MRGRGRVAFLSLLLILLLAGTAAAHAGLKAARPGPGDVLTGAPDQVVLDFDEALTSGTITLYGVGFTSIPVASRQEDEDTLIADLPALEDGRYTVQWDVVADDGDPSSGSYDFVVEGRGGGIWRWLIGGAVAVLLLLANWIIRRRRAAPAVR